LRRKTWAGDRLQKEHLTPAGMSIELILFLHKMLLSGINDDIAEDSAKAMNMSGSGRFCHSS